MANTMSYFDFVGEDCMERIMETSADQLEDSINIVVYKLMKYVETRYDEEFKINTNKFNMNWFLLTISCKVLKSV
jgi:hypothetical protein